MHPKAFLLLIVIVICYHGEDYDYDYEAGSRSYDLKLQASPPRGYAANNRGGNLKNAQEFATEGPEITEYASCCKASSKALCALCGKKVNVQPGEVHVGLPSFLWRFGGSLPQQPQQVKSGTSLL